MIRQHLGHLKAKQASLNMKMIHMLHVTISFQLGMISSLYLSQGHGFTSQMAADDILIVTNICPGGIKD